MTTLPWPIVGAWQPCPNSLKLGRTRSVTQISCAVSELQDIDIPADDVLVPENMRSERGVQFLVGSSFYREESAVGRDLGCLAAAVYKKEKGRLHVLDALSSSGIRAARYLAHSQADFVWANDACDDLDPLIAHNLSLASTSKPEQALQDLESSFVPNVKDEKGRWQVTIQDANKVLLDCYMRRNYFDLIDVDSFGSDTVFLGSALSAVAYGGLIYATSTDGLSSGGHRPYNALASYGSYIRPVSYANEIGLRMLIGGVVREAALRNMHVYPVFSHYSFHGPVFRVMLRVLPNKKFHAKDYNFIAICNRCRETQVIKWSALGRIKCSCASSATVPSLSVNGPLWTGPLHNTDDVKKMIEMAESWGWIQGNGDDSIRRPCVSTKDRNLKKLLDIMVEESNPALQVGYIDLDEISTRSKGPTPRREGLIAALHQVKEVMAKRQCSMCSDVSKRRCKHCASSTYCSMGCQRADWPTHRVLCRSLQQHSTPPPDASTTTRRGIFFPVDTSTPEFVWVDITQPTTPGTEHITSLKPYLGDNGNSISIKISHNVIRSRRREADHVELFMRDTSAQSDGYGNGHGHDLPLNRSVAMLTGGLAFHSWRGGMLAMKKCSSSVASAGTTFSDMDTVDFRDVVDSFRSYKSGVDMNDASASPRHTGPASILEERLLMEAAERLLQFETTPPPPAAAAAAAGGELPDVQGVMIRYDAPHGGAPGKGDTFEAVAVPSTDPVWSNPVTDITERLGLPVRTRMAREHHPENRHLNEAAMSLHTSVDVDPDSLLWGRAPYPIDGSVLVVRSDRADLSLVDVDVLCFYCRVFLAPHFDESRRKGAADKALRSRVLALLSKASLRPFAVGIDVARRPESSVLQFCAGLLCGLGLRKQRGPTNERGM